MTSTLAIEERGEVWTTSCTKCGASGDYAFGDRAHAAQLSWWTSFRCDVCRMAYEEDGKGPLPEALRALVLRRFGLWGVHIVSGSTTAILKLARETLELDAHEMMALKAALPGPLFVGTEAEASRMHNALEGVGVTCRVSRLDAPRA